ncbi:hypothetical protein T440DRAFT_468683 [Plenodomus tracheiphilus IPT5]|uniref:Uncharacterized protein n=1 Tax=Plenodomus tracheiphilus IPT5 TaxID=1408161 RepID=A0A6A7B4C9_9PLEO|nr:hypothetical protein T440DRAFT_468683 [Plenodomus tracheiphilus IPT5]
MSDYGDDYSDYGDDWLYVEDEYMAADDLAEHAVASPPPTTYGDEDNHAEWDRFDYFNDIEYGSDGYDDAAAVVQDVNGVKAGQKRKRVTKPTRSNKRRSMGEADTKTDTVRLEHTPVVWRSQAEREPTVAVLDDNAQSYSLLKDWREKLANTPRWTRASPPAKSPSARPSRPGKGNVTFASAPASPPYNEEGGEEEEEEAEAGEDMEEDEAEGGISQEALMAALQRQLASAGGPLSGMDPQQLLEFAMRMATDKDAGDDIAGEMADAMLEGEDEEDDAGAEENLLSWVAQQRNANKDATEDAPKSPVAASDSERPPTPPSSEANRSIRASATTTRPAQPSAKSSLKRKADEEDDDDAEGATKVVKKRVTRSFNAPTAASQARAAPAKVTRSTRGKKS